LWATLAGSAEPLLAVRAVLAGPGAAGAAVTPITAWALAAAAETAALATVALTAPAVPVAAASATGLSYGELWFLALGDVTLRARQGGSNQRPVHGAIIVADVGRLVFLGDHVRERDGILQRLEFEIVGELGGVSLGVSDRRGRLGIGGTNGARPLEHLGEPTRVFATAR
jgi:hypothetical protein